jgi:hypothetical protein
MSEKQNYSLMKDLAILFKENPFRCHTITPGRFLKKAICDKRCKIKTFAV